MAAHALCPAPIECRLQTSFCLSIVHAPLQSRLLGSIDAALASTSATDPAGVPHLVRLVQVLLACAVASARRDEYVSAILDLPESTQEILMELIQGATEEAGTPEEADGAAAVAAESALVTPIHPSRLSATAATNSGDLQLGDANADYPLDAPLDTNVGADAASFSVVAASAASKRNRNLLSPLPKGQQQHQYQNFAAADEPLDRDYQGRARAGDDNASIPVDEAATSAAAAALLKRSRLDNDNDSSVVAVSSSTWLTSSAPPVAVSSTGGLPYAELWRQNETYRAENADLLSLVDQYKREAVVARAAAEAGFKSGGSGGGVDTADVMNLVREKQAAEGRADAAGRQVASLNEMLNAAQTNLGSLAGRCREQVGGGCECRVVDCRDSLVLPNVR